MTTFLAEVLSNMNYERFGNKFVVRLDAGDEICESIKDVIIKENIKAASVSGIGGAGELHIGVFNEKEQRYSKYDFVGTYEIASLVGNIGTIDGEPLLHLHITAAGDDARVVGGHLLSGVISLTGEVFIDVIDGEIKKIRDEKLGINVMDF